MQVIVSSYAGFCFGVSLAIKSIFGVIESGKKCCTLGEIVHNPSVIKRFKNAGGIVVDSPEEVPDGCVLVLRSHGVGRDVLNRVKKLGVDYVDSTCPFVKKIHSIVARYSRLGYSLLVAGNSSHCEVQGIMGNCFGTCYVFESSEKLMSLLANGQCAKDKCVVVAQTTFSVDEWTKCCSLLKKFNCDFKIFDTICRATALRQQEAKKISERSDLMIVVGGCNSSNSLKLRDICEKYCRTCFVEEPDYLNCDDLGIKAGDVVGVTAGASVPYEDVLEIKDMLVDFKRRKYGFGN